MARRAVSGTSLYEPRPIGACGNGGFSQRYHSRAVYRLGHCDGDDRSSPSHFSANGGFAHQPRNGEADNGLA
jgi:hypothetical protein